MRKGLGLFFIGTGCIAAIMASLLWLWHSSRAQLEGQLAAEGLSAKVIISRDAQGLPFIQAESDADLAFALGFLHGQEYFFSMDLGRRLAAGELSAMVGPAALDMDKDHRLHRFRQRARQSILAMEPDLALRFQQYSLGVNQGLSALSRPPAEYSLLRIKPEPWRAEDSLLMIYSMYLDLQPSRADHLQAHELLRAQLPREWYEFISQDQGQFNTLLTGDEPISLAPMPKQALADFGLRSQSPWYQPLPEIGSNNFVLGPELTGSHAMLGGDMHLSIGMPNLWYRASWQVGQRPIVAGITLPGAPALVAGSNGHLSWAFTNSYGAYQRLLDFQPLSHGRYRFGQQEYSFNTHHELIEVKGQPAQLLSIEESHLGPVIQTELGPRILQWTAHHPWGMNANLVRFEQATNLQQLLALAPSLGIPQQSMLAADRQGNILWTLAGPLPPTPEPDGRWPAPREQHPHVLNPPAGYLLSANQRLFAKEQNPLGQSNSSFAVRAWQLEQGIKELTTGSDASISSDQAFALMLDSRAPHLQVYLQQIQQLIDRPMDPDWPELAQVTQALANQPLVAAEADSLSYPLIRFYRDQLMTHALQPLADTLSPHNWATSQLNASLPYALERLTQAEPEHLLPSTFASWQELKWHALQQAFAQAAPKGQLLPWGEHNRSRFQHPLSSALPLLSPLLDSPAVPQSGDRDVPRVMRPDFGASQRMLLIPGQSDQSLYHAPGGQSGHPRSPFYRTGLNDFHQGLPRPLLPENSRWQLVLTPLENH